ncbi:unnamed protein product, partial [Didymodactylos carnosus]
HYFDLHEYSIVRLIQIIYQHTTGRKPSRNDVRIAYHYHKSFGNILPSIITIIANIFSVIRIIKVKGRTKSLCKPCRRSRESRRVLIIITVECLLAVLNSWFIDVSLSFIYCKQNLSIGNDCPAFIRKYYDLVTILDFINSMTNIPLHCLCGKVFRRELSKMLYTFYQRLICVITCSKIPIRNKSWYGKHNQHHTVLTQKLS